MVQIQAFLQMETPEHDTNVDVLDHLLNDMRFSVFVVSICFACNCSFIWHITFLMTLRTKL